MRLGTRQFISVRNSIVVTVLRDFSHLNSHAVHCHCAARNFCIRSVVQRDFVTIIAAKLYRARIVTVQAYRETASAYRRMIISIIGIAAFKKGFVRNYRSRVHIYRRRFFFRIFRRDRRNAIRNRHVHCLRHTVTVRVSDRQHKAVRSLAGIRVRRVGVGVGAIVILHDIGDRAIRRLFADCHRHLGGIVVCAKVRSDAAAYAVALTNNKFRIT